jgi:hypothetical protein
MAVLIAIGAMLGCAIAGAILLGLGVTLIGACLVGGSVFVGFAVWFARATSI